jgi:hypothetical protein
MRKCRTVEQNIERRVNLNSERVRNALSQMPESLILELQAIALRVKAAEKLKGRK